MDKQFEPNPKVLARFAEAFQDNTSMNKTGLHLVSKLRWNSFVKYMDWLRSNYYIKEKDERYVLTEDGTEMFDRLLVFMECFKQKRSILL